MCTDLKKTIITVILLIILFLSLNSTVLADDKTTQTNDQKESQGTKLHGSAVVIDINSDELEYFEDKNEFVATGNAKVNIKQENSTLEAQKITYDQENQIIIAEDKVTISKNGQAVHGSYAKIKLNDESALINNPKTTIDEININAKTANIYGNKVELLKGTAIIDNKDLALRLSTLAPVNPESLVTAPNVNQDTNTYNPNYKISAKEVIIKSDNDKNVVIMKNATIWLGKIKIATVPSLELTTNRDVTRIETMLPEFGRNQQLGTYFGPSHVFDLPHSSTLKISPLLSFGGKDFIGGGGLARFTSKTNRTLIGYTSNERDLIVAGEQKILTPYTKIQYGAHSYINDGIFGDQMPTYIAELVDSRKLISALNFNFFLRSSAGYAQDYDSHWGTAKLQFQGNLINDKPLLSYKDYLKFRLVSQFSIAGYGNGSSTGMLRAGPNIQSKLGRLNLTATYFEAATHGKSPFNYDRYVQGKSILCLGEELKVTRHISLGDMSVLNLTKDNSNNKLATENEVYAKVGPNDFKFKLGYDIVRNRSVFGFDMLVGNGKTGVDFDKLTQTEEKNK